MSRYECAGASPVAILAQEGAREREGGGGGGNVIASGFGVESAMNRVREIEAEAEADIE